MTQIFHQLWWLLPLLVLASLGKTPWFKGIIGELLVVISAKFRLDDKTYLRIHNATLKTLDGTTQIDHIFFSIYGIFVVETKNYSGWIFGSASEATWTQKLFKKSSKFQNPLRQNYKHLKALELLCALPLEKFHSVVVFVGDSKFKTKMPENVTYAGDYVGYIKSKKTPILSPEEVSQAYAAVSSGRMRPSIATNREHVENVKARIDPTAPRLCPKCGSAMTLRTAKSGKNAGSRFWACSQFPKCRTTQNIA